VFGCFEETMSGYRHVRPYRLSWLVKILNGVERANY
jgi:ribonucleoside-diphosphate reductase beta chain